ncbi:uncharacterized protein MONOS_17999 [Monocercomonoides exilis]|uniref:uncharacterized protein n=1 Tax=Monocercomonoides exilis TaxID=2049356 RepID=UPI00355A5624|nr:hypothetical protein MONOS_17999 [Monocercomonoides exilis]
MIDKMIEEKKMQLGIAVKLLREGLKKGESEDVQKDVDLALSALGNIKLSSIMKREMYLNEITEIIKYHQAHHNLTHLAYQSAWQFLTSRTVSVVDLLRGGAFELILGELPRLPYVDGLTFRYIRILKALPENLEEEMKEKKGDASLEICKREISEKLEEEGFEDILSSYQTILSYF